MCGRAGKDLSSLPPSLNIKKQVAFVHSSIAFVFVCTLKIYINFFTLLRLTFW